MNNKNLERLQSLMTEIGNWSDKQFNNGEFNHKRSISIAHHLEKESKELTEAITSFFKHESQTNIENVSEELADTLMLLLDCAFHIGYDADDLVTCTYNKLEINKKRSWGKPDKNGVVEHIREAECPTI